MADLLRLLFLVPLGYVVAVFAAAAVVVVSWFTGHPAYDPSDPYDFAVTIVPAAFVSVVQIGAVAALPALVAIVAAELFRWRSIFFYLAVAGGIGLIAHVLSNDPQSFADRRLLFPAAGLVGGFAYWLIAGRLAGGASRDAASGGPSDGRSQA